MKPDVKLLKSSFVVFCLYVTRLFSFSSFSNIIVHVSGTSERTFCFALTILGLNKDFPEILFGKRENLENFKIIAFIDWLD